MPVPPFVKHSANCGGFFPTRQIRFYPNEYQLLRNRHCDYSPSTMRYRGLLGRESGPYKRVLDLLHALGRAMSQDFVKVISRAQSLIPVDQLPVARTVLQARHMQNFSSVTE